MCKCYVTEVTRVTQEYSSIILSFHVALVIPYTKIHLKNTPFNRAPVSQESKWRTEQRIEWNKVLHYKYCIDNHLAKIKTPFQLLQNSSDFN